MADLVFTLMGDAEFRIYRSWFSDEILHQRIQQPDMRWVAYVRETPGVYAWLVYEGETPVGQIQMDVDEMQAGHVAIAVNPQLRKQGYGKRMLTALLSQPEVRTLTHLKAGVEADNLAGQRTALAVGFVQQHPAPDAEGFLDLVYTC